MVRWRTQHSRQKGQRPDGSTFPSPSRRARAQLWIPAFEAVIQLVMAGRVQAKPDHDSGQLDFSPLRGDDERASANGREYNTNGPIG
jgi:hypothetical protein